MNTIIIGCGKVGQKIAEKLSQEENQNITVIDTKYDLVQEIIERQMRKHKTRLANRYRSAGHFQPAYLDMDVDDTDEVRIVRTKKFAIKPMDPEEACLEMELSGHTFFVFRNSETDDVNVVYKRKGNTYGLIEPEY